MALFRTHDKNWDSWLIVLLRSFRLEIKVYKVLLYTCLEDIINSRNTTQMGNAIFLSKNYDSRIAGGQKLPKQDHEEIDLLHSKTFPEQGADKQVPLDLQKRLYLKLPLALAAIPKYRISPN